MVTVLGKNKTCSAAINDPASLTLGVQDFRSDRSIHLKIF